MEPSGRTALVTGASSGLGKAVTRALAARGTRVLMVARDEGRGRAARDEIAQSLAKPELRVFACDLASQGQIRDLSARIHHEVDSLHYLVNNAGTAFRSLGRTEDGIERALAVNHLAPFLLTHLLLDLLHRGAPARVVNVGTQINTEMDCSDFNWDQRPYTMMAGYGQSKLGNIHFTRELARRLAGTGVTVNCVYPGVFRSNLGGTDGAQGVFWKSVALLIGWALPTPERAAERVLHLLTSDEVAQTSGAYFGDRVPIPAPAQANDLSANQEVWRRSADLVGLESAPGCSGTG